jgi:DNA-binding MarR family transcriptional regulator
MKSSFDLGRQNKKLESRIVVALERISEAFRVLLWQESKENALSPIQTQLLLFLLFHSEEKCKVSYLAQEFNMSKATISDSVKLLLQKELVQKLADPDDTRSYRIGLTAKGKQVAEQSSMFASSMEKPLNALTPEQKQVMFSTLLYLIHQLNQSGVITLQRMCFTCSHYKREKGVHHCTLLGASLAPEELRLDCPDHANVEQS